ncbi:MAG: hypothetical protein ACTS27_05585 [Phycisphaerales bacterium]
MTIGPDNPIVGRIDSATEAAAKAQQATERREQRRQRVEPVEGAQRPRVSDRDGRSSKGPLSLGGPTSTDVLKHVPDYARTIPPPEDLLAIQASANTFALINLDAAKEIARGLRDAVENGDRDGVRKLQDALFSDTTERGEVAAALAD